MNPLMQALMDFQRMRGGGGGQAPSPWLDPNNAIPLQGAEAAIRGVAGGNSNIMQMIQRIMAAQKAGGRTVPQHNPRFAREKRR